MPTRYSRARFGAAIVVAFFCGLIFASGFDLTRFSWAQSRVNASATKPTAKDIAPAADLESAFEAVADHARPAVVSIETERFARQRPVSRGRGRSGAPTIEDLLRGFDDPRTPSDTPEEASGSGFIVSADGFILTNNHVVADADKVTVTLFDKTSYPAKIIGRDPTTDVAVIKIEGKNFPTLNLGDDAKTRVGQWALAIGNPLQLNFTVTAGIISAKGRNQSRLLNPDGRSNPYAITDYIQTDAAINPGNSGGPLLNIRGDVIGINSAIASGTGYYAGYGFAIPITLAKQVMDDLIKYGKIKRAVVGVNLLETETADAKAAGLPHPTGAKVTGFPPGMDSPAEKAGMEVGDIIIKADGKEVDQVNTLQRIIRGHKPGDVVEVEVMRFGSKKTFRLKLGEAAETQVASNDEPAGELTRPTNNGAGVKSLDRLGIAVEPVSNEFAQSFKLDSRYRSGLRIASVAGNGPSYRNLFANQIILGVLSPVRRDIKSVEDLQSVLSGLKSGDVVSLKVCGPNPADGSCTTNAVGVQIEK
jgi:serine protease Do